MVRPQGGDQVGALAAPHESGHSRSNALLARFAPNLPQRHRTNGAHLATLKAFDKKILDLCTQQLPADTVLRTVNTSPAPQTPAGSARNLTNAGRSEQGGPS